MASRETEGESEGCEAQSDDMSAGIYWMLAYKATADKQTLIMFARTKGSHISYGDGGPKGSCAHSIRGISPHSLQGVDLGFCFNSNTGVYG